MVITPFKVADAFLQFFEEKVKSVRAATASQPSSVPSVSADTQLLSFQPCSQEEVRRLITASPIKSSALDPNILTERDD